MESKNFMTASHFLFETKLQITGWHEIFVFIYEAILKFNIFDRKTLSLMPL